MLGPDVAVADHVAIAPPAAGVTTCVDTFAPGSVIATVESARPLYSTGVAVTVILPDFHTWLCASVALAPLLVVVTTTPSVLFSVNAVVFVVPCTSLTVVAVATRLHAPLMSSGTPLVCASVLKLSVTGAAGVRSETSFDTVFVLLFGHIMVAPTVFNV